MKGLRKGVTAAVIRATTLLRCWRGPCPASHKDGAAVAWNHRGEVGGAGGEGPLAPRGRGDVQRCGRYEDVGDHDKQHGGRHKEQGQEEVHVLEAAGVRAGKLDKWAESQTSWSMTSGPRNQNRVFCRVRRQQKEADRPQTTASFTRTGPFVTVGSAGSADGRREVEGCDCEDQEAGGAQGEVKDWARPSARDKVL